jgi:thymidine phosphorylase
MRQIVARDNCVIASQSSQMIPADRTFYAVRDVTSTVSSLPLITGSIISKKAAEGLSALILDIKVGSAAFMKTVKDAEDLARSMIETAEGLGIQTRALLSWMENPIGDNIGNALEIEESIDILQGKGPEDSIFITAQLGAHLLEMTGLSQSIEEGEAQIRKTFQDGSAMMEFKRMLKNHHVSNEIIDKLCSSPKSVLPQAKQRTPLTTESSGYISSIDGMAVALLGLKLKAGRAKVGDIIDPAVGIVVHKSPGTFVNAGETWGTIHHTDDLNYDWDELSTTFLELSPVPVEIPSRIIRVMKDGD